jgi:AcrR family transcriptional regulator
VPSPAAEHGREVRQRLLSTAAGLIPERGWTAVSTRVLAERAGVTPSVVHYHFPSLAALLNEAVVGTMRQVLAEQSALLDLAGSPGEGVDALLAAVGRRSGMDSRSLVFAEAYLAASRDEHLREQLNGLVAGFRDRLGSWLRQHRVASPDDTAAVLAATVDGLLLHRGFGGASEVAAVLRRLVVATV